MYNCFNLDRFLDAAFNNFQKQAAKNGSPNNFIGVLCLADTPISIKFNDLLLNAEDPSKNNNFKKWQFFRTHENVSLHARSIDKKSLFIIAGQQIVSKEKLELLAIGTDQDFQNGIPIKSLINDVIGIDAIPILPWGFCKWTGQRKRIIECLLKNNSPLFYGDSSGRFVLKRHSFMDKIVRLSNKPVLNGTDPLPLSNQDEKPGRFGFIINHSIDPTKPWLTLKKRLDDSDTNIVNYGEQDDFPQIFLNQFLLRM